MFPGIPYNEAGFYCSDCGFDICIACRATHPFVHGPFMIRVTYVRWQKIMKNPNLPPTINCRRCLEAKRCRVSCQDCDWSLCGGCFEENVWRQEFLKKHDAGHRMFWCVLPPWYEVFKAVESGVCDCLNTPNCVMHCGPCGRGTE